jgi:putative DNA methylase
MARQLAELPKSLDAQSAIVELSSATSLAHIEDGCITAVIVDPPYYDNVQYSELADYFYVWLSRTIDTGGKGVTSVP